MHASLPPPPLDHGVVGNGRVLALISPTSAVEWLCLPRFDSPSVFARILDREKGGTFIIEHASGEVRGAQSYLTNTNILRTVFEAGDAAWEVIDFAPRLPDGLEIRVPFELARLVRPLRGHPRLRVRFDPRPDYARAAVEMMPAGDCLLITGAAEPLRLFTDVPMPYVTGGREFALDRLAGRHRCAQRRGPHAARRRIARPWPRLRASLDRGCGGVLRRLLERRAPAAFPLHDRPGEHGRVARLGSLREGQPAVRPGRRRAMARG
jgi:hypothetical protein